MGQITHWAVTYMFIISIFIPFIKIAIFYIIYIHATVVISEPDDVTICEESGSILTCVLNGSMTTSAIPWYRLIKDSGIEERVDGRGDDISFVRIHNRHNFTTETRLYFHYARRSYAGYYWVKVLRAPLRDVCNTSVTVTTST